MSREREDWKEGQEGGKDPNYNSEHCRRVKLWNTAIWK